MNPFNVVHEVEVTRAGAQRVRQEHLWVYASDVPKAPSGIDGPFVRVVFGGKVLGHAFFSPNSQIRLRMISTGIDPPTPEFFAQKIRKAIARRPPMGEIPDARRLVFGEADLLPSIIVDRYANHLVIQTLSRGADLLKPLLVETLREIISPAGIYERNDIKARGLEGLELVRGPLWGSPPGEIEIFEGDIAFLVDISKGQKTGFFIDQSHNRLATRNYVTGRALDCFTNSGGFALHFARRCESVVGIDISEESLQQARRNAKRNALSNVEFRIGNVFDSLRELERLGEKFDTVSLDPPAFAKNRAALQSALGGYKEINLRAMKLLNPEGILVTSSCSYHLSEEEFLRLLSDAARDVGRFIQIIERRGQSTDHPVLASMPETRYLKCFILRVL